jgi:hypothetical protein
MRVLVDAAALGVCRVVPAFGLAAGGDGDDAVQGEEAEHLLGVDEVLGAAEGDEADGDDFGGGLLGRGGPRRLLAFVLFRELDDALAGFEVTDGDAVLGLGA